jgi:aryl-alcohol dehydrogenase-like predicted oxidoreductase
MKKIQLGQSDLHVTPICLGTMTFGEQVDEPTAHAILSRSLERGVDFIDTAEMYSVPTRKETYSYQIHWPERHVPAFGNIYYDPAKEVSQTPIHEQLDAFAGLVKAGKIRAIGLSNETPYGVHEFVRLAEQHGLPRVATVQNVYNLASRGAENGLDETMHRLGVSLLAYSPLAYGLLTGKYDKSGITGPDAPEEARITRYESVRKLRWGRPDALKAARLYNQLARDNGLTPTKLALAFCYTKWQVASTIIGVRTLEQLDEDIDAYGTALSPEILAEIDRIRWDIRDPAA